MPSLARGLLIAGAVAMPLAAGSQAHYFLGNDPSQWRTASSERGPLPASAVFSTYLGGTLFDQADAMAVDRAGNVVVAGFTDSTDFPTVASLRGASGGGRDVFVAKISPSGSVLWATYLGGSGRDQTTGFNGVAVDSAGNVYVTGFTASTDFPTVNPLQGARAGSGDAFVAKLSADGSRLIYSTYLGGRGGGLLWDAGNAIAVDAEGNAYVTGTNGSPDFPVSADAFQKTPTDPIGDAFVAKISADGSRLIYATHLWGTWYDSGDAIAVDAAGNAYVTGSTSGVFPVSTGAYRTVYAGGNTDVFVAKVNPTGSALVWATYLGGQDGGPFRSITVSGTGQPFPEGDQASGLAIDSAGNIYVCGFTPARNFATLSAAQGAYRGGALDSFLVKLNPTATAAVYATYLGGSGRDEARSIAVDPMGGAWVTGNTASTDFPTADPLQASYGGGDRDIFVTRLEPDGSRFSFSTYFGGSGWDSARALALDSGGDAYFAGASDSPNFPVANAAQADHKGAFDAIVVKMSAGAAGPSISAVENAATSLAGFAAGSWIAIKGLNLSQTARIWSAADFAGSKLPKSLDGVSVKVNGRDAAVYYISRGQVNALAPTDSTIGLVDVTVSNALGTSAAFRADLRAYSPGVFTFEPDGGKYAAAVHPDGVYVGRPGLFGSAAATRPAQPEGVILLYTTGLGPTNPPVPADELFFGAPPLADLRLLTVRIGGAVARVDFAGLVSPGLYQINAAIPNLPAGDHEVLIEMGAARSKAGVFVTVSR